MELSEERPMWIFSAFGPGFQAPAQLFGGESREQSFEEMRVRHYELAARGQAQQAIDEAQKLHRTAADQNRVALQDVDGAIDYIVSAERTHPNRIDICKQGSQGGSGVFSRANAAPSTFGQSTAPPSGPSGFGRPFAPAAPFASPNAARQDNSFPVAQPTNATNPFARASVATASNPFSRASGTFGSGNNTVGAPFGGSQPVAATPGPFGGSTNVDSSMGSPKTSNNNPTNSFGAPTPGLFAAQPFGGGSQASQGGFGQPHGSTNPSWGATLGNSGSSGTIATNGAPHATQQSHPPTLGAVDVQRDGSGKIRSWGGKAVSYLDKENEPCIRRPDGSWERIWFPDGPPARTMPQEIPLEKYDERLEQEYQFVATHGSFRDGVVPPLPPKWEWTSWDF